MQLAQHRRGRDRLPAEQRHPADLPEEPHPAECLDQLDQVEQLRQARVVGVVDHDEAAGPHLRHPALEVAKRPAERSGRRR